MLTRRSALGAGLAALAAPLMPAQAAAPLRGGQAPGWYRFRVGAFECTIVSDGAIGLAPPFPMFGAGVADTAQVEAALRGAFLPTDVVAAQINVLAVNTGQQLVLLDAGLGPSPAFGPGAGVLARSLVAAGIQPAEVDVIAFTHAHGDHAWGIADATGNDVFPNARFLMTEADLGFWAGEPPAGVPDMVRGMIAFTRQVVQPRRARFVTLAPNGDVAPGIRAVATPGHTAGHVSFHLESEGQRLLVTGDVANHHLLALNNPDWPFGFDADPAQAVATRRRFFGMAATDRVQVLGYHFPWPGLGHVETRGNGFGWVPSPWRWG
jgi:glyoxylase-like metal-dependent hydrolase (beta-lactamase superfamily II)